MPVYGYDSAWNKVEVAEESDLATLAISVASKQEKLNATGGAAQSDPDTLRTTGIYYVPSTADNIPSNSNYVIIVCSIDDTGTAVMQVAITVDGTYIYTRMYVNTTWTIWKRWASQTYVNSTFTRVYSGTTIPDPDFGKNGDIYYYISDDEISKIYTKLDDVWKEAKQEGSAEDLAERVGTLEIDVEDVQSDVSAIQSSVTALDTAVNTLEEKVPTHMKMLSTTVTIASGVGQVTFETMGITGRTLIDAMCVVRYASSAGAGNCFASVQLSSNYINVYIRNGVTSSLATDGTYAITLFYTYT